MLIQYLLYIEWIHIHDINGHGNFTIYMLEESFVK